MVRTDPEAGRSIKKGTTITLYRSTGEETFEIEDYTGQNYIAVQTELELHDISVNVEKRDVDTSKEYDEQEIVGQSVAAGEKLKKGDSITLYIPNIVSTYPDMLEQGWSREDAEDFASTYNLNLTIREEETTAYEEGKVIRQSRAAGSPIVSGASITITVAKRPTTPTTPSEEEPTTGQDDPSTETGDETTSGQSETSES